MNFTAKQARLRVGAFVGDSRNSEQCVCVEGGEVKGGERGVGGGA